jgi:hypothetical protein
VFLSKANERERERERERRNLASLVEASRKRENELLLLQKALDVGGIGVREHSLGRNGSGDVHGVVCALLLCRVVLACILQGT